MEQEEYFGFGSMRNLKSILDRRRLRNIFLVTGRESFESCGAKGVLNGYSEEYNFERFCDFSANPKKEEIERGFELFKEGDYDGIVGVGGGSVIDTAKAIKLFHYRDSGEKVPLVAIPTTAGSGSEATYFIVYYDGKEKQSEGILDVTLPNYAICDPRLVMSLPKNILASTGMDALGQAIESYWSVNSTEESKEFARRAINLLTNNLEKAVNSSCLHSRTRVMKGANLAGKAINLTKTTACHSIAYPMTSYFGIPHGHAVGLTLGEMLVYNGEVEEGDCSDKRGWGYVRENIGEITKMLGVSDKMFEAPIDNKARDKIYELMESIGLETKLSRLGLGPEDIELIIEKGFNPDRVKNNPRLLSGDNLKRMLESIY